MHLHPDFRRRVQCVCFQQGSLYPGEEDMENWLFGESTLSALLTFQVGTFQLVTVEVHRLLCVSPVGGR